LEEVCGHQWITVNKCLLAAKKNILSEDWIDIKYEDLFRSPENTVKVLFDSLGLVMEPLVVDFVRSLDAHVTNTDSPPAIGKWSRKNRGSIQNVIPLLCPMMNELGYNIEEYTEPFMPLHSSIGHKGEDQL
jgi:hypothetical protein